MKKADMYKYIVELEKRIVALESRQPITWTTTEWTKPYDFKFTPYTPVPNPTVVGPYFTSTAGKYNN
jgi:hypothetical protein